MPVVGGRPACSARQCTACPVPEFHDGCWRFRPICVYLHINHQFILKTEVTVPPTSHLLNHACLSMAGGVAGGNHPALCLCAHMLPDEYSERDRLSPDFYEESETDPGAEELPARIFVALFDYDPLTMSPNPDAAEEELPFKEGQIIKVGSGWGPWAAGAPREGGHRHPTVTLPWLSDRLQVYGDKDADGFYRGETCARLGLIPCNMVSEIQADDEEMMDQLLRQGFLPLNTPVEKIGKRPPPSPLHLLAEPLLPPQHRPARSGRQCGQGPVGATSGALRKNPLYEPGCDRPACFADIHAPRY